MSYRAIVTAVAIAAMLLAVVAYRLPPAYGPVITEQCRLEAHYSGDNIMIEASTATRLIKLDGYESWYYWRRLSHKDGDYLLYVVEYRMVRATGKPKVVGLHPL